jgi:ferredoxin-NADP reductase
MATQTIVREYEADLEVVEARIAANDVVALTLAHPAGEDLPPWTPGAHIDLILAEDVVRQYSLCGSPAETGRWRVGVLKTADSRGGSKAAHELAEGAKVRVRGPRNHFPFVAAKRYLFVAGGIGITPLLPMIAEASAARADWRLIYGGRSRASMAFIDELAAYGDRVVLMPQDEAGMPDLYLWSYRLAGRDRTALLHLAVWLPSSRTVRRQGR